jgi:hypothetical protein
MPVFRDAAATYCIVSCLLYSETGAFTMLFFIFLHISKKTREKFPERGSGALTP